VAISAADLILLRDDHAVIPEAISLACATLAVIRRDLAWAFGYNIAAIPLAAAGFLNPLIAGAAMAASSARSGRSARLAKALAWGVSGQGSSAGRRNSVRSADQRLVNAVQRPESYREVVLRSAGARIVLSVWDAPAGNPVALFLPGTMTHPLFYEEFLDALNRDGLTVVGLHGQGHGKSPRARRPLTFSSLVENARDAVTWIRTAFPGRPLAVVGSSQGSILAMALAAADHRIDAVSAHNILDPALPSTIQITRFPHWLTRAYPAVLAAFRVVRASRRRRRSRSAPTSTSAGSLVTRQMSSTSTPILSAAAVTRCSSWPVCSLPTWPGCVTRASPARSP
jgi:hypothetical protein